MGEDGAEQRKSFRDHKLSSKSSSNCWSECACGNLTKSGKGTTEKEQREHLWNSYRAGTSAPPRQGGKCPNPKDIREIKDYSEEYCLSGTNLDLNKDDWIPSHHLNSKPKKPQFPNNITALQNTVWEYRHSKIFSTYERKMLHIWHPMKNYLDIEKQENVIHIKLSIGQ